MKHPMIYFLLLLSSLISYVKCSVEPDTPANTESTQIMSQIDKAEDFPTFDALVDLMKSDQDDPEISKDAKRVEKLTSFLSKFKVSLEKVNYQAQRFKETIYNRGQNYQDMKQLLKDIYHKMMQDAFDEFG